MHALSMAALLVACGAPETPPSAPPAPLAPPDARPPPPDATPLAPPDAAPTFQPRPAAAQLRADASLHGHAWVQRTYGPPTAAEVTACEAECGRESRAANASAPGEDLRRLGCAKVTCDQHCLESGVPDFRCH